MCVPAGTHDGATTVPLPTRTPRLWTAHGNAPGGDPWSQHRRQPPATEPLPKRSRAQEQLDSMQNQIECVARGIILLLGGSESSEPKINPGTFGGAVPHVECDSSHVVTFDAAVQTVRPWAATSRAIQTERFSDTKCRRLRRCHATQTEDSIALVDGGQDIRPALPALQWSRHSLWSASPRRRGTQFHS